MSKPRLDVTITMGGNIKIDGFISGKHLKNFEEKYGSKQNVKTAIINALCEVLE